MVEYREIAGEQACRVGDDGSVWEFKFPEGWTKLVPTRWKDGAWRVRLPGSGRSHRVDRLVMEAFVGPKRYQDGVLHLDGDGANCSLGNLRYADGREITEYLNEKQLAHELSVLGDRGQEEVRQLYQSGKSIENIAKMYHIKKRTVEFVTRRRTWQPSASPTSA